MTQGIIESIMAVNLAGVLKDLNEVLQQNLKTLESASSGKQGKGGPVRDGPVDIYLKIIFLKVGEITTVTEKFVADVFIQSRWREPALDKVGDVDGDLTNWKAYWNPEISIDNALSLKEDVWYAVSYNDQGEAFVLQKRRASGTFYERMELMKYPCDTQDLSICVTTDRGDEEVRLNLDPDELSAVNVATFVDEQEWVLYNHVMARNKVTTNAYKSSSHKHPAITLCCKATRRSRYFIWNIILIMIFISSLVFTTFTVSQQKIENRLQLSFILLLSNITFKFTINQTLPRVSYLTLMDKYIIGTMAQICLVCVWHAVLSTINGDEVKALQYDRIVFGVLGGGYLVFNLVFLIMAQVIKRKQKKYEDRDLQHTAMVEGQRYRMSIANTSKNPRSAVSPTNPTV